MNATIPMPTRLALLAGEAANDEANALLAAGRFEQPATALAALQRLSRDANSRTALAQVLPYLLLALGETAHPDRVLMSFERFVQGVAEPHSLLEALAINPRTVEMLVRLFDGSQFLTEILLRNPEYFVQITSRAALALPQTRDQLLTQARSLVRHVEAGTEGRYSAQLNALRRWQRLMLLRIGTADLLDLFDLATVVGQLTALADSLVQVSLEVSAEYTGIAPAGLAVIALGKLGGNELNYSSDIDLLFITEDRPEDYRLLGERLIEAVGGMLAEGFLYRVDMRLRAWGRTGPLVSSRAGYLNYLRKDARPWEKQMLLKARTIAGDHGVGAAFLREVTEIIYAVPGAAVKATVLEMRQRTEAELRKRGLSWAEVKEGQGSIRDVEFLAQYLQLAHGDDLADIRSGNTLDALSRLQQAHLLAADEYRVLTDGYTFLRTVEHHLQLMDYRQTHVLPKEGQGLNRLARRLQFAGVNPGEQLVRAYDAQRTAVREVYARHLLDAPRTTPLLAGLPASVRQHTARMTPDYSMTFSPNDIARHAELATTLSRDHLLRVETAPLGDDLWQLTVVAYDYLGELSLICGLLFVHGLSIMDGHVFTYEPTAGAADERRKIVDVFTVQVVQPPAPPDLWTQYTAALADLLRKLEAGDTQAAQGALVLRVAMAMDALPERVAAMYPVDVTVDNQSDPQYTVMRIEGMDTPGFLYEFTNALALQRVHIGRVTVGTTANRVHDLLYVTDERGQKITDIEKERELRAATVMVKYFTHLLPNSPNPELALLHFRALLRQMFEQPNWPEQLMSLERPEVLTVLVRLLGVSEFLWTDFLRMQYTNLFPLVEQVERLGAGRSRAQMQAELAALLTSEDSLAAKRDQLNAFKDREMFRIDMRSIVGQVSEYGQFSDELTDLAEVVVGQAVELNLAALADQYGQPRDADGQPCALSITALGKCGGRELGFASDIELMIVYASNGQTTGPKQITTAEFYEYLVAGVLQTVRAKREGIFEIDLRLRPYGNAGSMAVPLAAYEQYFAPGGPAWDYERQALIRLRPIWGDPALSDRLVQLRDAYVYTGQFDVAAMRAMRERQIRHLVQPGSINLKYSPGGLADIEYLVQALQMIHGRDNPTLRLTNTQKALVALSQAEVIDADGYARLRVAHVFVRRMVNALRMVRGNAKDVTVPPLESDDFAYLARRMDYGGVLPRLYDDLIRHTSRVQSLLEQLLG